MRADGMNREKAKEQDAGGERQRQHFSCSDQNSDARKDQDVFEPPRCSIKGRDREHPPNHEEGTRHESDGQIASHGFSTV